MTENMNSETIYEDAVKVLIFSSSLGKNIDKWVELCTKLNKRIELLSEGYIWHRDEFKICLPIIQDTSGFPPHLTSLTNFGDNIDDEWFIVYITFELSKQFKDIVIQINDNDGEFLLIEAADSLPKWANPESTQNRVFIHNNQIHLIPPNLIDDVDLEDAIKIIENPSKPTEHPLIKEALNRRIADYSEKIADSIHRCVVNLPIDIAALLNMEPKLIAPIVNAYCNHDILDAKVCKDVKLEDCATTPVKFTKCLYAMLTHSKIMRNNKQFIINEKNKRNLLGLKLTCGYKIVTNVTSDVFTSKPYLKFIKSLTDNGYFRGNLEGSRDYKQLLEQAKEFFLNVECPVNTHVANKISQLINSDEFKDYKMNLRNNPLKESDLKDDNEDWLNIHPDELNELLNSRYGKKYKKDDVITPATLTTELSNFLKQSSDYEGIEKRADDNTNIIEFDADVFAKSLEKMLNMVTGGNIDEDDSDSDLDDESDFEDSELDKELKSKLKESTDIKGSDNIVLENLIKSMKEEAGSSGPASNVLKTIGIHKTDVLDSDDDENYEMQCK